LYGSGTVTSELDKFIARTAAARLTGAEIAYRRDLNTLTTSQVIRWPNGTVETRLIADDMDGNTPGEIVGILKSLRSKEDG
jgi:hypothetical protein